MFLDATKIFQVKFPRLRDIISDLATELNPKSFQTGQNFQLLELINLMNENSNKKKSQELLESKKNLIQYNRCKEIEHSFLKTLYIM